MATSSIDQFINLQWNMKRKSDWLIPLGLILLTIIPAIAGIIRIIGLSSNEEINTENERFHSSQIAVLIHITSSLVFGLVGAFQFSKGFRSKNLNWHRNSGIVLILMGLGSAISGLYLTQIFPKLPTDGPTLYFVRLIVGFAMIICIAVSIRALLFHKFKIHGNWMTRAYAIGLGAGMQVVTHLPWFIITGRSPSGLERDFAMTAGWIINIIFVEWRLSLSKRKNNS